MRALVALAFVTAGFGPTTDAHAWEFSTEPICTVTDAGSQTALKLTYDGTIYTLHLTHSDGWASADIFAIRFAPNGPFIQTTRHQINGTTLSVADTGFGNVLTGLQINQTAQAMLGETIRDITLEGAFKPVEKFKSCKPHVALS
jgi:hypothetical protein